MERFRIPAIGLVAIGLVACQTQAGVASAVGQTEDGEIDKLSDEFDSASSLGNWKRIGKSEGWNVDQLEKCAIENGELVLMPYTSTWYMDYRGVLVYKDVPGDFVVTTKVKATGRDGRSAPRGDYSLGGIMVRKPRTDTAQTWRPGGENYVFLSIGSADKGGQFQFEVKTTQNSQSNLEKIDANSGEALLQVARIGNAMILLRKQGGNWAVHKRYSRPDMAGALQVGLTTYTNYNTASRLQPREQNGTAIKNGNPDLIAKFDFVRYRSPQVPAGFDALRASDADLIRLLGDSAM